MIYCCISIFLCFVTGLVWVSKSATTESKFCIFQFYFSHISYHHNVEIVLILFRTTASECKNPKHNTHAFDLNGAMSAYLLFFLLIIYIADAFLKYKDRQLEIHASNIRLSEAPQAIDEHKMTELRGKNKSFHQKY